MKVKMIKGKQERFCQATEQELLKAAGWKPADAEQAREEVIRLKPAVNTKATVRALDEANIEIKGDD